MRRPPALVGRRRRRVARWLPLVLLAAWSALAQESDDPGAGEVFFDAVDATVVNVEVFVTDKKGQRVTDLDKDDFEILENGRPVKITNFYAVADGRPRAVGDLATLPEANEPGLTLTRLDVPEAQRLSMIVYVDNLFLRPFNRNKVLRAARTFLNKAVQDGDQVMVVAFNRSLKIQQAFTEDLGLVEATLLELEEVTGSAVQADTNRRDVIRRIDQETRAFEAESHALSFADSVFFDVRQSIGGLKETVDALAGLPGRKALLYVSDGLPMTAGEDLFFFVDQRFGDGASGQLQAARYRARSMIRELTARANAHRVTFYAIEGAGLRSHGSLSAEYGGQINGGSRIEMDTVRTSNVQATLEMLAGDTGGLAAFGTNNLGGAFDRLADDFRTYYSLGYQPTHADRGRYHRIEVRLKRKGLVVRHRDGYRDKDAATRMSERTRAILRYGGGDNPLGVWLEVGAPSRDSEGDYVVPVEVKIPIGKLALLPTGSLHRGSVQVSLAAADDDGSLSAVTQAPLRIDVPEQDLAVARAAHYTYGAELRMRRGVHRIAVGVYDAHGGEVSFVTRPVEIGYGG